MNTLRIIGAGTLGINHLTKEALLNLKNSKKIIWLGSITGMAELLSENDWTSEDITSYYVDGAQDQDNYLNIKQKILEDVQEFKDISLVVLGHPRLGVTIAQELEEEAKKGTFKVKFIPGLSSFDTMINDVMLDPLEEGTCLIDVNRLLIYNYSLNPHLNYFIYHVCSIGNSKTNYKDPTRNNAIMYLKNKLLEHFPETHKVSLVFSKESPEVESNILTDTIASLERLLSNVSFASTLYIPHVLPHKSQINNDFLDHLMNSG